MSNIRIHRKVSDLHNDLFCWICTHLPGVTGFYRVSSTPAPNRDESPPQSNKRRFWWENQNKRDAQKRFSSIFFVLRFPFFFWRFFNGLTLSLSLRRRTPRRKTNGRRDVSFFSAPPLFFLSDDLRGSSVYFSISLIFGHFPNASWPTLREVPGGW